MATYDDDGFIYAENPGDKQGDDLSNTHSAIREMRAQSVGIILKAVKKPHINVVKITKRGPPRNMVRGYVTTANFLQGATPRQFERMLGFRNGALKDGCMIYYVDDHFLRADNIAPRAFTDWPSGISPRELESRIRSAGKIVRYHPDFPPASDPIPQFVIHRPVPATLACSLGPQQRFEHI